VRLEAATPPTTHQVAAKAARRCVARRVRGGQTHPTSWLARAPV